MPTLLILYYLRTLKMTFSLFDISFSITNKNVQIKRLVVQALILSFFIVSFRVNRQYDLIKYPTHKTTILSIENSLSRRLRKVSIKGKIYFTMLKSQRLIFCLLLGSLIMYNVVLNKIKPCQRDDKLYIKTIYRNM